MTPRSLLLLACAAALAACGGGGPAKSSQPSGGTALVSAGGPSVVDAPVEPLPNIAPPAPDQALYKIHVIDRKTQKPINRASVVLLRNEPEAMYMRVPKLADTVVQMMTRSHGVAYTMCQADGAMKWALVNGTGFIPTLVEAGTAAGGQTREIKVEVDILAPCRFAIRTPDGNRAANALCTMKPDEDPGAASTRPGQKANYGWTERADDLGVVTFNREPGVYRLEFSEQNGKFRWYERFTWDGQPQAQPREVTLPQESQNKPW